MLLQFFSHTLSLCDKAAYARLNIDWFKSQARNHRELTLSVEA